MANGYSRSILAGLLGFAAGVTVGILFAPEKGTETRKKLKQNFDDLSEELKSEFSEELEEIRTALTEAEDIAEEKVKKVIPKKRTSRKRIKPESKS